MRKLILVLLILLLLSFLLFGQSGFPIPLALKSDPEFSDLISNGDFNIYDSACVSLHSAGCPCPDPIGSGCVNSWLPSHGSPEFSPTDHTAILGAVKSNGYIWGEGIFQIIDQPLDSGQMYLLLFDYQLQSYSDRGLSYLVVQFTDQEFSPGTCFEMLPAPGWEIPGSPFTAMEDHKTAVSLFNAGDSFEKIWFYSKIECDSVSWIKIGNIHLFKINDISYSEIMELLNKNSPDGFNTQWLLSESRDKRKLISVFTINPCQYKKAQEVVIEK